VEVVLHYLKDRLEQKGRDKDRVRGYRGGYLPELRREIEALLRDGKLDGVVATNALELGIDVGGLDAVVLAGYPGTIAATHQRGGRAGRRQEPSLCVMIARGTPLDQFFTRKPEFLLESSPEKALVQPDNVEILLSHLKCAAFELPVRLEEPFGNVTPTDTGAALDFLSEGGDIKKSGKGYHYVASDYPAAEVNLRSHDGNNIVVYNQETNEPIAQVPPHSARFELHEGAIYQHDGLTFEVDRYDVENDKAYVNPVAPVYYTTAIDQTKINIVETREYTTLGESGLSFGDVEVIENMTGYKKIKFRSHENLGYGDIRLPPREMDTESAWITVSQNILERWSSEDSALGLEGVANALAHVASLHLMCDQRDIALSVQTNPVQGATTAWQPIIFLYDAHQGGVGLAARAFEEINTLLLDCLQLIGGCPCQDGCPACTGPINREDVKVKDISISILAQLAETGATN
jgi:DEAD/DEAH box helicase domain-containing protein